MACWILHQELETDAAPDARDVEVQAAAVAEALRASGRAVDLRTCTLDLRALDAALRAEQPAVVVNLVEDLSGSPRLAALVPALLEARDIPFTGCPALALQLTLHKTHTKERLRAAGLPTPGWITVDGSGRAHRQGDAGQGAGGWLLKSDCEHASLGVAEGDLTIDPDPQAATQRLRTCVAARGTGWFAEAYVEGREFNVALLEGPDGLEALPAAEIIFDFPPGVPHILGYRAKWETDSFEYRHTRRQFDTSPAELPLREHLERLARRCGEVFGLRGYARVDFRVDAAGEPWILEVNSNPCLSPDAGFAAAVAQAGYTYRDAVERLIAAAVAQALPASATPAPTTQPATTRPTPVACRFRDRVQPDDPARIRALIAATGYFFPAETEVAVELVDERLAKGDASGYAFILAETTDGELAGYVCFGPTPCTQASFDLYWIAVHPARQGSGLGRELMAAAEQAIRRMGGRRVYVETSNRAKYVSTRTFYLRCGYVLASLLEDFYAPGDGKATYVKELPL